MPTKKVATAPYKFIALPKTVMPSALNTVVDVEADEKKRAAAYKEYILKKGKNRIRHTDSNKRATPQEL